MYERFLIIYDSECNICLTTKKIITGLDKKKLIKWVPINCLENLKQYEKYSFNYVDIQKEMTLIVDHTYIYKGYFAFKKIIPYLKGIRVLSFLFYLPFSNLMGPKIYQKISRNRKKLLIKQCSNDRCSI